ncbi:PTS sugar transporter subunit IIA [Sulfurirhabdus autotrophica]|nr:PTS sugar transporter subunit IIA [Sulfurirhabdus autotrophica]
MGFIAKLLPQSNVMVDLDASSKNQLFEQAGELFEANSKLSKRAVIDSFISREKLGSTGLGQGVAIPHGRIKNLTEAVGAFFKLQPPIAFDSPDNIPVSLVFVLLVPAHATDLHLEILGELAEMFCDKSLRDKLLASHDVQETYQLLTQWVSHDADNRTTTL